MDHVDGATPRSGRKKKASALSRLAAQKNTTKYSDESDKESRVSAKSSHSRDDLADALNRQRLTSDPPAYPIEADVRLRQGVSDEDSDEGIGLGSLTGNGTGEYGKTMNLGRTHSWSPSNQRKHLDVKGAHDKDRLSLSEEDDDEDKEDLFHIKGEKRSRDQNSDGDDLAKGLGRTRSSKRSLVAPIPARSPSPRPRSSRQHVHVEPMDTSNYGIQSDSDLSNEDLGKTHVRNGSEEDLRIAYKQVLDNKSAPSKGKRNQLDSRRSNTLEQAEMTDTIGEMRRMNHDRSLYNKSPIPHASLQKHLTNSSMQSQASSVTSSMYRNRPWSALTDQYDTMSVQSSVLSQISTKQAKQRSMLAGTVTGGAPMLGTEELERYFPDHKMRIFVGTWNMCEMKEIPQEVDDFLLPDTSDFVHDAYIIGTQESISNRREWEVKLQETLGPQHVLLHSAAHGVLYLNIFIRRDLLWYCSVVEEASISTRPGPTSIKTKGAVGVSFMCFGTSFLFLNSHLSPHDGRIKDRIADHNKISTGLNLPKVVIPNEYLLQQEDITARFDCVFWLGDLNFRLEKECERVKDKVAGIETQDYEDLMKHDELFRARNEGLAFQDFQEGRIKFRPTYKYDIGTDEYDSSKKMRIPSYTDRVLFRCRTKHAVTCLHYDSAQKIMVSDHKPVYGMYEVNIRPGKDNIPLCAGTFNREVWLEANKRRATWTESPKKSEKSEKSEKSSTICSLQ